MPLNVYQPQIETMPAAVEQSKRPETKSLQRRKSSISSVRRRLGSSGFDAEGKGSGLFRFLLGTGNKFARIEEGLFELIVHSDRKRVPVLIKLLSFRFLNRRVVK